MAAYFFDSSALVKRHVRETGTAWVIGLMRLPATERLYIARIALVEIISAFARRQRGQTLSPVEAGKATARFRRNYERKYFKIDITNRLIERAAALAEKHVLRGYDAVQLAAALETNDRRLAIGASPLTLISADDALNAAAMLEGLSVDNPNLHP
ncbi:MAG: type II toxin-antitoxin system VapC family toxin [Acidobacteriota bacterium]